MKPRKSTARQAAQQYDITVKELLQAAPPKLLELILGAPLAEILTVELPKVRVRRPDFVVRTTRSDIVQIEVQSDNDGDMEWRMLEYYPLLRKLFGRPPIQIVLYIGPKPLKMAGRIDEPRLQFRYEVIDLSKMDAEVLLKSKSVDDKILAILCHADNEQRKIQRILQSLTPFPAKIQGDKIAQLLILSQLRGLANMITQEVQRQHTLKEILSESPAWHNLMRELYKETITQEVKQAVKNALQLADKKAALAEKRIVQAAEKKAAQRVAQVTHDEQVRLLTRLLESKFGKVPKWAKEKMTAANKRTLEKWAVRLLKAESLEEALR